MTKVNEFHGLSALDAYLNRVYTIILITIPAFCLCASATIVTLYYLNLYEVASETALLLFCLSTIAYFFISIYFIKTGFNEQGTIIKSKLSHAKIAMVLMYTIQWNTISYIWPYRSFWGFVSLFTIVFAFFFDVRLTLSISATITASMFLSWFIGSDMLLPPKDDFFIAEMVFRLVGIVLELFAINMITFLGRKFLVEELERYANYDTLTHLLNRRSMDGYLQEAYHQAASGKGSFCLLMADIDDFKKVNDTYGHDCGDEVLKYVAKTISSGIANNDHAFRWGGEEICVLLNTEEDKAVAAAERIRQKIQQRPVNYRDETQVFVTMTMGLSAYSNGTSVQAMMDDADAKLYWGKEHGKNQVVNRLPEDNGDDE